MAIKLFEPFNEFNFSNRICFLTGQPLQDETEKIQVFPAWLMSRYGLEEQPFKLLDESMTTYKGLKIPCAASVNEQYLEPLEAKIETAFNEGYEAVCALNELEIFGWAGKILYGIIFNELHIAIRQQHANGEAFNISQSILHKFRHLHLMLQSINQPMVFEGFKPFSLFIFRVNNAADQFNYRDEVNTLTFSFRVKDVGIIICFQDNGANKIYHRELLEKIGSEPLHPIQFEEFCGRVFYSAYLFNRLPEYHILPASEKIFIETMPLRGLSSKPLFDVWNEKTYGQVLENFWKNWGYLLFEIIKNPERPMSFLLDEEGNFRPSTHIDLPL